MTESGGLDRLQEEFGIPGVVRFEAGPNGMNRVVVAAPQAEAHLYLHGAHVAQYLPRGEEPVLFMSARSRFEPGKPIRGGVPIVFPWFGPRAGDPAAPAHGFARVAEWRMVSASQNFDGSVTLVLRLDCSGASRSTWPHEYELRYRITVGAALDLAMEVQNLSAQPVIFEEALHTYLAVSDVRQISVHGLGGSLYIDKTDEMRRKVQGEPSFSIVSETDRVYLGTRASCVVEDSLQGRRLVVIKGASEATVVWNPWTAKAQAMSDFGDEEWQRMLCVETANVADHAVVLTTGGRHEMRATIRAERH